MDGSKNPPKREIEKLKNHEGTSRVKRKEKATLSERTKEKKASKNEIERRRQKGHGG